MFFADVQASLAQTEYELAGFCYGKRIVVVIFVALHKGLDMLGRDKLSAMA
ncbi:MAG: hypothetical protein ACI9LE_001370 [Paraglaciecola sp.]|jgi:hypothetical protein